MTPEELARRDELAAYCTETPGYLWRHLGPTLRRAINLILAERDARLAETVVGP